MSFRRKLQRSKRTRRTVSHAATQHKWCIVEFAHDANLREIVIAPDAQEADLIEIVRTEGFAVIRRNRPFFCTITGYENDHRELWEIPEVVSLCQRIISSGLLGLLEVNVGPGRQPMLWGAMDVLACASGWYVGRVLDLSPDRTTALCEVILAANQTCNRVLAGGAP